MNEIPKTQALAAPALSKSNFKPLRECVTLGEAFASQEFLERIRAAAPDHVKPGRLLQTFVSAVSKNALFRECSVRSYIGAALTLSQTGFEANTALGHAYLIPFRDSKWNAQTRKREQIGVNINVVFGYPGLIDLSYRTRLVRNIHPDVVFPGDEFSFEYGSHAHLKHIPHQRREGDTPLFAYMHATLSDGEAFEVLPYADVLRIRNKSQAFRSAAESRDRAQAEGWNVPLSWSEAPWVAHEHAMARKTAVRAGSKWLPRSVELANAIALDEAQERRQRMDFGAVMDAPTIDGTPDYLGAAMDEAQREEESGPADPAASFTDRRPPANDGTGTPTNAFVGNPPADKPATTKPDPAREAINAETKPPATSTPAIRMAAPATALAFESVLIDQHGEPGEVVFTSAIEFAAALVERWYDCDGNPALREHNADAIEDARAVPEAARILGELDAPLHPASDDDEAVGQNVTPEPVAVIPPLERGKPSWKAYVQAIKTVLAAVGPAQFVAWAEAQRATLAECPMAQRVLIVRAIVTAAGQLRLEQPAWLGELMRAPVKPAEPSSPATTAPQTEAADPGSQRTGSLGSGSADERWVDSAIADLDAMGDRVAFDAFVSSTAVRQKMARLRRENLALFERADNAFAAKYKTLGGEIA